METLHLETVILAALFIGVRVGGVMLFAPFFSGESIPPQVKLALTVALTALLYPVAGRWRLEAASWAGWKWSAPRW